MFSAREENPKLEFGLLLGAMILNMIVRAIDFSSWLTHLSQITTAAIFVSVLYIVSHSKRWLLAISLSASPAIINSFAITWLGYGFEPNFSNFLFIISYVSVTIFLVYALARAHVVNQATIYAAMCAYLMIAHGWTYIYLFIESLSPGSFMLSSSVHALPAVTDMILVRELEYLSYITITTLGFGDVLPLTPVARAFVSLEAVVGQLYLTIVLARLVSMYLKEQVN